MNLLPNRNFVIYIELAFVCLAYVLFMSPNMFFVRVLVVIVFCFQTSVATYLLGSWTENVLHHGIANMRENSWMIRRYHNVTNNVVANTIGHLLLFGVTLSLVGLFTDLRILIVSGPLVVMMLAARLRIRVPPAVLVLGGSGQRTYRLSRWIMAYISPLTVAELLNNSDVDEGVVNRTEYELSEFKFHRYIIERFFAHCRIMLDGDLWKKAVKRYALVAEVIVLDLRDRTAHTDTEVGVLNQYNLWYKVAILQNDTWMYKQDWFKTKVVCIAHHLAIPDEMGTVSFVNRVLAKKMKFTPEHPIGSVAYSELYDD